MEGQGSENPTWLFVGEAPGATEDKEGIPFCGATGLFLRDTVTELGFPPEKCRWTNVNRCWPGDGNPTPGKKEIDACRPFLLEEIEKYKPKVVIALGRNPLQALKIPGKITKMHGTVLEKGGITYVCAFHPSFVSRNVAAYGKEWIAELQMAKRLGEGASADEFDIMKSGTDSKGEQYWVKLVQDMADFKFMMAAISSGEITVVDYENWPLKPWFDDAKVLSIAFCNKRYHAFSMLLEHEDAKWTAGELAYIWGALTEWFESDIPKSAANAKHEIQWTKFKFGAKLNNVLCDPITLDYLIDENRDHDVASMAGRYTNLHGYDRGMKEWWFTTEKGKKKEPDYRRVPGDILCKYGGIDTIVEWLAMDTLMDQIDVGLLVPHNEILMPAAYSLASVEAWGWQVDVANAATVIEEHGRKINESLVALRKFKHFKQFEEDKGGFNVDSFQQKCQLFYGYDPKTHAKFPDKKDRYLDMEINPTYQTASGHPSTDKEWRLAHITKSPILSAYNKYVKLHTILKDFFNVLPGYLNNIDCRIHTNYNASKVKSGRLSSSDPNTQNWPDEKYFWKLFISRYKNGSFIKCDYSQFELRWLCHLANDLPMIQTFQDGKDIHIATARDFMKITDELWDKMTDREHHDRRQWGKRFNFAVANDRGAYHLSLDLTALQQELYPDKNVVVSKEDAQKYIDDWYKPHTAIKEWKAKVIKFCEENGYVVSPYNYRRHAPDIRHHDIGKKNAARRAVISFMMQSSAGIMMLKAKNAVYEHLVNSKARTVICGSCYDSVYLDAPEDEAQEICATVKQIMLGIADEIEFKVPLQVDIELGPNGGELQPFNE